MTYQCAIHYRGSMKNPPPGISSIGILHQQHDQLEISRLVIVAAEEGNYDCGRGISKKSIVGTRKEAYRIS